MFVVLLKMYLFIFIYRRDFILKAYSKGVGMGLWTMFVVLIYMYKYTQMEPFFFVVLGLCVN